MDPSPSAASPSIYIVASDGTRFAIPEQAAAFSSLLKGALDQWTRVHAPPAPDDDDEDDDSHSTDSSTSSEDSDATADTYDGETTPDRLDDDAATYASSQTAPHNEGPEDRGLLPASGSGASTSLASSSSSMLTSGSSGVAGGMGNATAHTNGGHRSGSASNTGFTHIRRMISVDATAAEDDDATPSDEEVEAVVGAAAAAAAEQEEEAAAATRKPGEVTEVTADDASSDRTASVLDVDSRGASNASSYGTPSPHKSAAVTAGAMGEPTATSPALSGVVGMPNSPLFGAEATDRSPRSASSGPDGAADTRQPSPRQQQQQQEQASPQTLSRTSRSPSNSGGGSQPRTPQIIDRDTATPSTLDEEAEEDRGVGSADEAEPQRVGSSSGSGLVGSPTSASADEATSMPPQQRTGTDSPVHSSHTASASPSSERPQAEESGVPNHVSASASPISSSSSSSHSNTGTPAHGDADSHLESASDSNDEDDDDATPEELPLTAPGEDGTESEAALNASGKAIKKSSERKQAASRKKKSLSHGTPKKTKTSHAKAARRASGSQGNGAGPTGASDRHHADPTTLSSSSSSSSSTVVVVAPEAAGADDDDDGMLEAAVAASKAGVEALNGSGGPLSGSGAEPSAEWISPTSVHQRTPVMLGDDEEVILVSDGGQEEALTDFGRPTSPAPVAPATPSAASQPASSTSPSPAPRGERATPPATRALEGTEGLIVSGELRGARITATEILIDLRASSREKSPPSHTGSPQPSASPTTAAPSTAAEGTLKASAATTQLCVNYLMHFARANMDLDATTSTAAGHADALAGPSAPELGNDARSESLLFATSANGNAKEGPSDDNGEPAKLRTPLPAPLITQLSPWEHHFLYITVLGYDDTILDALRKILKQCPGMDYLNPGSCLRDDDKTRKLLLVPPPPSSGMQTLRSVMAAAKELRVDSLYNLCCAWIADHTIRVCYGAADNFEAAHLIRQSFHIQSDWSRKETDCLKVENEWPANEEES